MQTTPILLTFLLLLFVSGPLLWLVRPHRNPYAGWLAALPPLAVTIWLLTQISSVYEGTFIVETYAWAPQLGLDLSLRLDGLSLFFGLIITGIGTGIALYTAYYLEHDDRQGYFYSLLFIFMMSMLGLVWADNLLTLFVFWEGTSITSYLMVGYKDRSYEAQEGARRAFLVTGFGGIAMLGGLVLLGQVAGTYTISELLTNHSLTQEAIYPAALVLILIGAFTKSAQFPFHFWLPGAMTAPTPASAYLHSATMVKAGIYLLARLHPVLSDSPLWFWSLLVIGGLTMLIGAITAIGKWDLKAILAYATISQLGILVMTLAFESEAAAIAVVVGITGHALYKGALFMVAGIVDHAAHTRDIRRLANLRHALPWTAAAATISCLSMAGIPPLFGFVAKETLLETLYHHLEHEHQAIWWIPIILTALASIFFVGYSLTFVWEVFWRAETADGEPTHVDHKPTLSMVIPALVLSILTVVTAFGLDTFMKPLLSAAATSIAGETVKTHLALWHGLSTEFLTSLTVIGLGILLFYQREMIRRLLSYVPSALDGAKIFSKITYSIYDVARWTTRFVQGGTLASQASIILLAAVAMLVYALIQLDGFNQLRIDWDTVPQVHEVVLALLAVVAAIVTVYAQSRLNAIISIGVVGLMVTLVFVFFGAPDLALTQLLIEVLTVVLLVLVFYKIPPQALPALTRLVQIRNVLVALAMGIFGFSVVLINGGEPFATRISDYFLLNSVPAAHGANVVNVILVDFRGFDTMGEITVLAIAALGGYALLRSTRLHQILDREPTGDEE